MTNTTDTYNLVSTHYAAHLENQPSTTAYNATVAASFGYTPEALASIPTSANLGVSCGNPLATANLRPGETLLDLGCGAGLDVFLASRAVGPTGRAIGVDMTPEMVSRANEGRRKGGFENAEFVLGNITDLKMVDASVDVVTSNCVVNLVPNPEKGRVFKEIFRVLRAGGRAAISDILAKGEMPEEIRSNVGLYVGCVSGACEVTEYEGWMREAGFNEVVVRETGMDLNVYKEGILAGDGCGESSAKGGCGEAAPKAGCGEFAAKKGCGLYSGVDGRKVRLEKLDLNEFVASYQIFAIKPEA